MRALPSLCALCLLLAVSACAPAVQSMPPSAIPTPPAAAATAAAEDLLLPVRHDPATGRVQITIRRMGEEMLYVNTLATGLGVGSSLDRGQIGSSGVVRFERQGTRVLLVQPNTLHRASTADAALVRSVEESFPRSILASFAIASESPDGVVIDATDWFLSDVYDIAGRLGTPRPRIERDRSYLDGARTRAFPLNTEVHAVLTFVSDPPSIELRRAAPDGRAAVFEVRHSFVRLPDPPLAMRPFDPRAGLFAAAFLDFAQGLDADYRQRGAVRWRLEPRDPAAYLRGELTDPVRPIVYYMDPGIPEPYRTAFIDGGLWWNTVFETAGWRNAFRIEDLPAGADPMDIRYPMIAWVHRQDRGPSVGPSFQDPRTGEIVGTVVRMDSYRSLVDHDIYMGLVPAAGPGGLQLSAEAFAMARRRQHAAHEIGHTLGLAHNFIAASQGRASVMDYPYPLIRLTAQGRIDVAEAFSPSTGAHDVMAIRYAYTWYPSPQAEADGLRRIVREAEAQGLRYVGDAHVGAAGSIPSVSQWVEGPDMLSALERTMAVRRVLLEHFDARAAQPGEPMAVLNRRVAHVYLHHRYAMAGAIKYLGGMDFGYALAGESTLTTAIVPAHEQRRALDAILAALEPAELRIPDRIVALIPPVPPGFDGDLTLIPTPAGTALDPVFVAHSFAQEVVDGMLQPQRAVRLMSFHARDASNPSLNDVLTALVDRTWGAEPSPDPMDAALRRAAQRAVLDAMLDLAASPAATTEVRAMVWEQIERLRPRLAATGADAADRGHRAAALRDIARALEGRDDRAARPRPAPIALPWP